MKAAVLRGIRDISIEEVPMPEPVGESPVLVRIGAVGVCGSDVLRFGEGKGYGFPLVLGHEISGVVEEMSSSGQFSPGDKVAVFPCIPKPQDAMTEIGEFTLGDGYDYFGSRRDGGLQEFLRVPERNLVRLPAHLGLIEGAMVEPASVALHAMRKVSVPAFGVALVIGAGPIGNFAAQWLRTLGVSRVIVSDVDAQKRKVVEALGFETIAAESGSTESELLERTGNRGADIVVEASGLPITLLQALASAAHRGQVVLLGDLSGDTTIPKELISRVLRRELTIFGTWNSRITPRVNSEWDMVAHAFGQSISVDGMVSGVFTLDEAQKVFTALANRDVWSNKTIFAVSEQALAEKNQLLSSSLSFELAVQIP